MGMDSNGGYQIIKAKTPLAEMNKYSTALRSLTQGRASFNSDFSEYAPVPGEIQHKLASAHSEVDE